MFNLFKKFSKVFTRKTVIAKNDSGEEFRFKVHKGNQIWLTWCGLPFPLEMKDDGTFICKEKSVRAYNKPYTGWTWRADDHSTQCPDAEL